jgi:hypothetical protein
LNLESVYQRINSFRDGSIPLGFHFRPGYGLEHHYFNSEKPKKGKVAIHDYDLEYEQIKRLAAAKLLTLAEPCVSGCPEKTHIPPTNLAPGGACSCKASNPLPVALPGFCRAQNTWTCFIACPGWGGARTQLHPRLMTRNP